jgi:hypothetical protein
LKPQNTILEELKEIAPTLMEVGIAMPYSVQNGYFEHLAENILEKVTIGLAANSMNNGFKVPDQYFSGLAIKIMQRVNEIRSEADSIYKENESIAPILNTIPKGMPFSVPEQYFNQFSIVSHSEKAKVIPIKKMGNWITYAAAAVFLGIMVTGSFIFADKKQSNAFEKYQQMDIAAALDQVSDSELNSYMDENHAITLDDLTESDRASLDNVDDKIESMSTENLSQYLNENGSLEMRPDISIEK